MTTPGTPLTELAALFLRLGATAFGGPAVHIAMLEDEAVRRRGWLSREQFLDLLGATNLIPGPNSTEMAMQIGRVRAGLPGLVVSGVCFILPAAILTLAAAWAYVKFGTLPQSRSVLYGVKPVVLAVVIQALLGLGKTACRTRRLALVAMLSAAANVAGTPELAVLLGAGLAAGATRTVPIALALAMPGPVSAAAVAAAAGATAFGLWGLFFFFLKVGSVLYGSGYVLLSFLRADLVDRWHWLTEGQLIDAVAVGQLTPGPLSSTATFAGYLLGGVAGAAVATAGIFLPAFVIVAAIGPFLSRLRESPVAGAFLDGVNAASLALMAVVTLYLGRAAVTNPETCVMAVAASFLLVRLRVNSAWLIAGGAVAGFLLGGKG